MIFMPSRLVFTKLSCQLKNHARQNIEEKLAQVPKNMPEFMAKATEIAQLPN
jgi:hypothetical protein